MVSRPAPYDWQHIIEGFCKLASAFCLCLLVLLVPCLSVYCTTVTASLRVCIASGQPLSVDLAARLLSALHPACVLLNLYGCTEAGGDSTVAEIDTQRSRASRGWVDVGRPLPGAMVAIVPPDHTGEKLYCACWF